MEAASSSQQRLPKNVCIRIFPATASLLGPSQPLCPVSAGFLLVHLNPASFCIMQGESLKEKSQEIEIAAAESPNREQTLKSRSDVPIAGGRQGPLEPDLEQWVLCPKTQQAQSQGSAGEVWGRDGEGTRWPCCIFSSWVLFKS